jgi:hypothetical protein
MSRNIKYCNSQNIKPFNHLLTPRYKGLDILLGYPFDTIIDATLFYPKKYHNIDYCGSMLAFIKDEILTRSYLLLKEVTIQFIDPTTTKEVLTRIWRQKDQEIKNLFLKHKERKIKFNLKNRRVILYLNNVIGICVIISLFTDTLGMILPIIMTFLSSKWYWNEFRPQYLTRYKLWDNFCCTWLFFSVQYYGGELLVSMGMVGVFCYFSALALSKIYGSFTIFPITAHILFYQFTIMGYLLTRINFFSLDKILFIR